MTNTVKNLIFVIVLLLLMIGGLIWYVLAKPHLSFFPTIATSTPVNSIAASNTNTSAANAQTQSTPSTPSPQPASTTLHIIQNGQYYDIDLQYPSATPLSVSAGASANTAALATIKALNQSIIDGFMKDGNFSSITPDNAQAMGLGNGEKYSLTDGFTEYTSPSTVSYVFAISEDLLGAHPNTTIKTITFDLKAGQALALGDLFISNSFLNTLSALARTALTAQEPVHTDPADFINPGTAPTATNFQNFAIDRSTLILIFPPYQVAPYSSGPMTVKIPLSSLRGVLKTQYIL